MRRSSRKLVAHSRLKSPSATCCTLSSVRDPLVQRGPAALRLHVIKVGVGFDDGASALLFEAEHDGGQHRGRIGRGQPRRLRDGLVTDCCREIEDRPRSQPGRCTAGLTPWAAGAGTVWPAAGAGTVWPAKADAPDAAPRTTSVKAKNTHKTKGAADGGQAQTGCPSRGQAMSLLDLDAQGYPWPCPSRAVATGRSRRSRALALRLLASAKADQASVRPSSVDPTGRYARAPASR